MPIVRRHHQQLRQSSGSALTTSCRARAGRTRGQFLKKVNIDENDLKTIDDSKIDFSSINQVRYVDWAITTPIMLLVLLIVFGINTGNVMPSAGFYGLILFFKSIIGIILSAAASPCPIATFTLVKVSSSGSCMLLGNSIFSGLSTSAYVL